MVTGPARFAQPIFACLRPAPRLSRPPLVPRTGTAPAASMRPRGCPDDIFVTSTSFTHTLAGPGHAFGEPAWKAWERSLEGA
jgi:hypothetical protein